MGCKEIGWWSRRKENNNDIYDFERYLDVADIAAEKVEREVHFTKHNVERPIIFGDATPTTIRSQNHWSSYVDLNVTLTDQPFMLTPKYLHHIQPSAKIIVTLRNPVFMTFSRYKYSSADYAEVMSVKHFHACVVTVIDALLRCTEAFSPKYCAFAPALSFQLGDKLKCNPVLHSLQVGQYYIFLAEWFYYFPRNHFFISRLEDTIGKERELIVDAWEFLGLRPLSSEEIEGTLQMDHLNAGSHHIGEMLPKTFRLLHTFFQPANAKLAVLTNDSGYLWKNVK